MKTLLYLLLLGCCCSLFSCTAKCFDPTINLSFGEMTDTPKGHQMVFTGYVKGTQFATKAAGKLVVAVLDAYLSDTTFLHSNDTIYTPLTNMIYPSWIDFANYDWTIEILGHPKVFKIRDINFHGEQITNWAYHECSNSVTYYMNDTLKRFDKEETVRGKHSATPIIKTIEMNFNN